MTIYDYITPAPRVNQRIDRAPSRRSEQVVGSALSQSRQTVSVVIPAMNEAENLPYVLPRIPAWVHEVILVDGNSTDRTVAVARELWAMLDADGSTDPAEIPIFVGALLAGADFVKGSRFLQGGGTSDMPLHRKLGNWGFAMGVRVLFGGIYSDLCYGYNAFWRRVLPHMELYGDGFEIETIMNVQALRSGLKVVEVPSFEAERVHGEGRLRTIPDGWRVLKTIVRERLRTHPQPEQAETTSVQQAREAYERAVGERI